MPLLVKRNLYIHCNISEMDVSYIYLSKVHMLKYCQKKEQNPNPKKFNYSLFTRSWGCSVQAVGLLIFSLLTEVFNVEIFYPGFIL